MDNLIQNGDKYSLLDFRELILENGFDDIHDSIAQLSDSNGYFSIDELGRVELSWDENASTVCRYDDDNYTITEFLDLVDNLLQEKAVESEAPLNKIIEQHQNSPEKKNELEGYKKTLQEQKKTNIRKQR